MSPIARILRLAACTSFLAAASCQRSTPVAADPVLTYGEGFGKEELVSPSVTLRWAAQKSTLHVTASTAGRYRLTFLPVTVFSTRKNVIRVAVNHDAAGSIATSSCNFSAPVSASIEVGLNAADNEVTLQSDAPAITLGPEDPRTASFGLLGPTAVAKVP